jgi:hypothetical protein
VLPHPRLDILARQAGVVAAVATADDIDGDLRPALVVRGSLTLAPHHEG